VFTWLRFAALAAALLVGGCLDSDTTSLTERDDGRTVTLRSGQEFEAVLATTPKTGLSWVWPGGETSTVVAPVGKPEFDRDIDDAIRTGATGNETWRFRAVKPGRESVRLEYRRPWDQTTPPERVFTFTAEVQP
jgi:predicted secreted protein